MRDIGVPPLAPARGDVVIEVEFMRLDCQQSVLYLRSNLVAVSSTNSPIASRVLVRLERGNGVALHRQIEVALREAIRSGRLAAGSSLPPTRTLADELGVSRGVIVEAYSQLVAEGYLRSRSGGYTQVAGDVSQRTPSEPAPVVTSPTPVAVDFGYGRANVAAFPRRAWLRSVRRAITESPDERLAYPDGRGAPELREALAEYLNRVRGTVARPDHLVITNGYAQGVSLLLDVLAAQGAKRLAVEDPSANDDARPIAARLGLEVVPVPVDEGGVVVDALERTGADAVILTPSHQWPTGAVLSADARAAVVAWAQRTGALVIEDDYDAEYRYDRAPIGAIQGLAPDQVIYAGTASKTLAPGFRLGWFVLPPRLSEPFAAAKVLADRGSPVIDQLAFADFLRRGEFDRHLRRMRPIYRSRRDAVTESLADRLPQLRPTGIAAGLHLVAWLPDGLDEAEAVKAAAEQGVAIAGLAPYRLVPSRTGGLIFGYSDLEESAIRRGVELLHGALDGLPSSD
jgi:GntR family transcriptional regulator/MocR family aminotransferase